jgi:hypothetical protein
MSAPQSELISFHIRGVRVALQFHPGDLWIGVYWTRKPKPQAPEKRGDPLFDAAMYADWQRQGPLLRVFVTLIPCFPIALEFP